MKNWNVLLGFKFDEEPKRDGSWAYGEFAHQNKMLVRDKWHVLGRGRERILIHPNGGMWVMDAKMHYNTAKDLHVIEIRIKKA